MAYKRHAQGGRFKRGEFGDLGLRAYTEARDREIRVAKEQLQQEQAYSQQHLQQIQGSGTKEIQHNRMLQGITEEVGDLALANTKLRGKREVEEILGRAKEAEKQADFWKNFSTTYAGQYAKAAGQLYDFGTEIQHQQQMEVFMNHPEAQKALDNFGHLNEITNKNLLVDSYKAFIDKDLPPDQISLLVSQYSDMGLRMNHKTKMALSNLILKKWDAQAALIKREAEENEVPWNNENIRNLYKLRAHELLKEFGISPTSIAGRHLLNGIFDKSFDAGKESDDADRAAFDSNLAQRQQQVNKGNIAPVKFGKDKGNTITVTGSSYGNWYSGLNQAVIHDATRYRTTENGGVVKPTYGGKPNLSASFQNIGEEYIKSGYFNSWQQIEDHLLNAPIPDAKGEIDIVHVGEESIYKYNKKRTWGGKQPAHREVLSKAWSEYKASEASKAEKQLKADDEHTMVDINTRRQFLPPDHPEYFNINNPETIDKALETHRNYPKTTKMLRDFKTFNQFDKESNVVNRSLGALYKDADLPNLSEYVQHLDEDGKKNWASKVEQLELLSRNGLDKAGLNNEARRYLGKILNVENTEKDLSAYNDTKEDIKQEILYQLALVESDEKNAKLGDQAKLALVDKAITEQMDLDKTGDGPRGYGWARRKNQGLSTVFLARSQTEAAEATIEEVKTALKLPESWDTAFLQIKNNEGMMEVTRQGKKELHRVISLDDADLMLREITAGTNITPNETITWLVEHQPARKDGGDPLTEREIINLVFKGLGIKEEIPQGSREWATYNNKKEDNQISFNGINRYSPINQERCSIYNQCVNNGILVAGQNAGLDAWNQNNEVRKHRFYI